MPSKDHSTFAALIQPNPAGFAYAARICRTDDEVSVEPAWNFARGYRGHRTRLTPLTRWGTPEDVAAAVTAIATGHFPFSTGEVINVDGGWHLRRL